MMKNISYIKHSDKRAKQFQIKTMIVECDEKKRVIKEACSQEAKQHLYKMFEYYQRMKKTALYEPVQTWLVDDRLIFEYLDGYTLEQELDLLLEEKRIDEMLKRMDYLFQHYHPYANNPFQKTNEFCRVFGDVNVPRSGCLSFTNIDLVFQNIIICKQKEWIIDYEWMFDFPIPLRFVMYRALYLYAHSSKKRKILLDMDIMSYFHFTKEEIYTYDQMEHHFQLYVQGDYRLQKQQLDRLLKHNVALASIPLEQYYRNHSYVDVLYENGNVSQYPNLSQEGNQIVLKFHPLESANHFCIQLPDNYLCKIRRIVYDTGCENEKQVPYDVDMVTMEPNVFLSNEKHHNLIIHGEFPMESFELFIDIEHVDHSIMNKFYN